MTSNAQLPLQQIPSGQSGLRGGSCIHKDGKTTNSGHTCQKFCCPFRQSKTGCYPCNHKSWNNGRKNRGCMKYKTILSDYRFSIDRDAYNLSASMPCMLSVKRYKSRFKVFGQERLWVRNGTSSAKLNSFSHISALAIAPVTVLSASHSYRSGKQLRLICHTHIYFQAQFISGLGLLCLSGTPQSSSHRQTIQTTILSPPVLLIPISFTN